MRGSPLLQTIFIAAVFLLTGVPVYRLTRPADAKAAQHKDTANAAVELPAGKAAPVEVEAVFAPAPTDFQIKNLDQTILTGRGTQSRFHTLWTAAVPAEGADLVIQAHWPDAAASGDAPTGSAQSANPAAAKVTLRFTDGRRMEKSFWAAPNGTLTEVFTVPGDSTSPAP